MAHFHTSDQRKSLVNISHVYLIPMISGQQQNINWLIVEPLLKDTPTQ